MPDDAPPPRPQTPSAPAPAPATAETLLLHTRLLGDLRVPGNPEQAAELQALSARVAGYASQEFLGHLGAAPEGDGRLSSGSIVPPDAA